MTVHVLLNKLTKVKRTGDGKYMACCSAHADKTASLTISELNDGRVLLNCFAGCDPYSILQSVGLDWSDVMPDNAIGHNIRAESKILYPTEALEIVKFEAQIVCLIAYDIKKSGVCTQDMTDRLGQAMQTINKAIKATQ